MATVTPKQSPPPAVLHDIDWHTYTRLLRAFGARRFRLTYDRGMLEVMSPTLEHEAPGFLLGRFVDVLTEELALPYRGGGSVTLRRRKKSRGLEPDRCYWIQSVALLQGKRHLDLRVDPPPDLALEVDWTSNSIPRMPIYAALKVPEVWRLRGDELTFNQLADNAYQERSTSLAFPRLTPGDLVVLLRQQGRNDDLTIVRQFREWVKTELVNRGENR